MKANLKGLSGIKGLMLRHGEKLGIAVVGILAAMFVYASLGRPRLSDQHEPALLQQKITQTKSTVDQRTWRDALEQNRDAIREAVDIEKEAAITVPPEHYQPPSRYTFRRPVIQPTVPRTDPVLLTAVDVTATGGTGRFAFIDEKVQQQRRLEEARKADLEQQKLDQQQQQQLQNQNQGGFDGGQGRGEFGPGGEMMGMPIDPDHPDRRPVGFDSGLRPSGTQLMGDERVDRATWACVVAKVPIKEQIKLYRDAFENARGGYNADQGDFPRYLGYAVQRAEVRPGQELQWQAVEVRDAQPAKNWSKPFMTAKVMNDLYKIIQTEWPGQPMEIVDPRYLDPEGILAFPLPPLVGRNWGAEVTHPDIPLNPPPMEEAIAAEQQPVVEEAEEGEDALFRQNPNEQAMDRGFGPGMGRGFSPEMGRGEMGRGYGRGEMMGRGGRGEFGGEMGRGEMGGGFAMGRGAAGGAMTALPPGVTDLLLRFFDFTVEPGKRYKYRVRLIMHDPNRNVMLEENALDSTVLNRIRELKKKSKTAPPVRYAEWSDPSATVGIPLSGSVQVAEASAANPKLANDEPMAKLLVRAIDDVEGQPNESGMEQEFRRGAVANMIDVKKAEVLTVDGKFIDPVDGFDFQTGITVLDVRGGDSISRNYKTPARVLLMDPSGQLYIRNELDDLADVEQHRTIFEKPDRRRGRGGEMEMMDPRGGEGFDRGGFQRGFEGRN